MVQSKACYSHVDPDLMVRIAKCESGLRKDAHNLFSSASGIFQFLDSTFIQEAHASGLENKNSPELQATLAARMIAEGKINAWSSSKSCWSMLK